MERKIALQFHFADGGFLATEINDKGNEVFLGKEKVFSTDNKTFREAMIVALAEFANVIIPDGHVIQNEEKGCDETIIRAEIKLISE